MTFTASITSYRTNTGLAWAVKWRDESGKQHSETMPGRGKEAKAIAEERRREIVMGRWYVAPPQTLGAFLEEWLERYRLRVKESSYRSRRDALRAMGAID